MFRSGSEVRRAVHALFPGAALIEAPRKRHAVAVEQTRALMADESVPAIFEAAFESGWSRVRIDVLERLEGGRWGIRKVSSSTSAEVDSLTSDLACEKWTVERAGFEVGSVELVHVNPDYLRGSDQIDWKAYFRRVELIGKLDSAEDLVFGSRSEWLSETLAESLAEPRPPARSLGAVPGRVSLCPNWESCSLEKSEPGFVDQVVHSADTRQRMIASIRSRGARLSQKLSRKLDALPPPIWALDLESIAPAIPILEGTRPYQPIAFQWSLHRLGADGVIEHVEYLADGHGDPRPQVASWLVDVLGRDSAPVLVYGSNERRRFEALVGAMPRLACELGAIQDRIVSLLPVISKHASPAFAKQASSIERLEPDRASSWIDEHMVEVSERMRALDAFARTMSEAGTLDDEATLRAALLASCRRDSRLLLELYSVLREFGRPLDE